MPQGGRHFGGIRWILCKTVLLIIQALSAVALILVVTLQSGKSAGLSGAIAGAGESFMSRGNAKTMDAKLSRATKWIAIVFIVLTLAIDLLLLK